MAYHRKRRYKKKNDGFGDILGIVAIIAFIYGYTKVNDFIEQYPYGLAVVIAVATLVVALVVTLYIRRFLHKKHTYDAITVANVDNMEGVEFERYLAALLHKMGYSGIRLTEKFDYGIDIIAKKDGIIWGIQAKRYNNPVKVDAVRQAYAGLKRYNCDQAMVITNSTFSKPAYEIAKDNDVVLIGRDTLSEWIYQTSRGKTNRGDIL